MRKVNTIVKIICSIMLVSFFAFYNSEAVKASNYRDTSSVDLNYRTHVQKIGWQDYVTSGIMAGTEGKALRLEAIQINVVGDKDLGIRYKTHVQKIGWQNWVNNNAVSGTSGKALRLEGIRIELTGTDAYKYDIYYKTHVQKIGWQGWVKNGDLSGTTGKALRLEGIRIKIVPKGEKDRDIEKDNLLAKFKESNSNKINDEIFDDFNSDGNYEMFIETLNPNNNVRKLWFVTKDKVTKIDECGQGIAFKLNDTYFGTTRLIHYECEGVTGYLESYFYVDGDNVKNCLSYYGYQMTQDNYCKDNEYEVTTRSYYKWGHNRTYFLYWNDEEKEFEQYGTKEISQSNFFNLNGAEDAINSVYEDVYSRGFSNCSIVGYYYMKNNIVILKAEYNTGYEDDNSYEYYIFNYTSSGLQLNEDYWGESVACDEEDYFKDMPYIYPTSTT